MHDAQLRSIKTFAQFREQTSRERMARRRRDHDEEPIHAIKSFLAVDIFVAMLDTGVADDALV